MQHLHSVQPFHGNKQELLQDKKHGATDVELVEQPVSLPQANFEIAHVELVERAKGSQTVLLPS